MPCLSTRYSKIKLVGRLQPSCFQRHESTALHFYQNKQLELYAAKEPKPLTLRQLVFFGRSMDESRLVKSANYVRTELPVRIAHRLRDLQALPYVVVTQEGVARVYELYWAAFEKFRNYPPVTNIQENEAFCLFLSDILNEHASVIPSLSLGMSLSSPYLSPDDLDSFMRRMLVSRISRRVLAQHHIALSEIHAGRSNLNQDAEDSEPHVGIITTGLNVGRSIQRCAKLLQQQPAEDEITDRSSTPEVIIEGNLEMKFSYIREHLEYILFELLKNSMHATRSRHHNADRLPPIYATVAAGTNEIGVRISDQGGGLLAVRNQIKTPSDLFSFSHIRNSGRLEGSRLGSLRNASSRRGGVWATVHEQVESWQRSSVKEEGNSLEGEAGVCKHTRMGIGLPMSNIFATYFGGSLELVSLDGWGTDVYVRLPKLGTNLEAVNF